ncbi:MAG: hypothetical protein P8Z34_11785 [Anaerolineales bacterium]
MNARTNQHKMVIRGDVVIDWNIAENPSVRSDSWSQDKHASISRARGGALLLADLLQAWIRVEKAASLCSAKIDAVEIDLEQIVPGDMRHHHAYNLLKPYPTKAGETWRVSRFLGFERKSNPESVFVPGKASSGSSLLVLDDANLGFRQESEAWLPLLDSAGNESWVGNAPLRTSSGN